jgi:hypothetical protein
MELVLVALIMAIIAVVLMPRLLAARLVANETSAIASMRALCAAQLQLTSRTAIDVDRDGAGEEGYFAELAGMAPLRASVAGAPGIGPLRLDPILLSAGLGIVNGHGLVSHSGYFFQIWLPAAELGGVTTGIGERPLVGGANPGSLPNADTSEFLWCCYAWPMMAHQSGNRAFFINQQGELLQCENRAANPYSNMIKEPAFDEALTILGDMGSPARIGVAGGHDASIWTPVQ